MAATEPGFKGGDRVLVLWNGRRRAGTLRYRYIRPFLMADPMSPHGLRSERGWEVELDKGGRVGVPVRFVWRLDVITALGLIA